MCSVNDIDLALPLFVTTFVFLVATIGLIILKKKKVNLKSFLIYIPIVVMLLLVGMEDEFGILISLFNLLTAIWLVSEKSIYKKVFSVVFIIIGVFVLINSTYLDGLLQLIVLAATALTFVYLFEGKRTVKLEEGDGEDEE